MAAMNASALTASPTANIGTLRELDAEIKDMASYVHNYKIDSDLAVCSHSDRVFYRPVVDT